MQQLALLALFFTPLSQVTSLFNMHESLLPFPQNRLSFGLSVLSMCFLYIILAFLLVQWYKWDKPGLSDVGAALIMRWQLIRRFSVTLPVENKAVLETTQRVRHPYPRRRWTSITKWASQYPFLLHVFTLTWLSGVPHQRDPDSIPPV